MSRSTSICIEGRISPSANQPGRVHRSSVHENIANLAADQTGGDLAPRGRGQSSLVRVVRGAIRRPKEE